MDLSAAGPTDPSPLFDSRSLENLATPIALLSFAILWAWKLYTTWGAWGNLTIDSGHEMYVPALLAEGKELYRDVMSPYGPGAPYLTSYLYRLFGVNLNVLYWAGSLSALGSAIFLYFAGKKMSFSVAGWAAGAVVLMEAFHPTLFCFPLPYASAAVYGCITGCLFLWVTISAAYSSDWYRVFGAGALAALALLFKPEFGIACYGTLGCLLVARWLLWRSPKMLARDVALTLPGLAVCGLVWRWMVSIAGVEFITHENILSWPSSYFMRTYGKAWLVRSGFTVSATAFLDAFYRAIPIVAVVLTLYAFLRWKRDDLRSLVLKASMVLLLVIYFAVDDYAALTLTPYGVRMWLYTIFFPRDMVLYVAVGAAVAWLYFCWRPRGGRGSAVPLLLTFSGLLAFRILMSMRPAEYDIYFNGPVVLSFLVLLYLIVSPRRRFPRLALLVELALCAACITPVWLATNAQDRWGEHFVPLVTARGTVRVSPEFARKYSLAIQFMKDKQALGQSVLSLPEDTSLYFLSGTYCPTRVYFFHPGAVAPGKMMDETIAQIEKKPVDYLLWSNRTFAEYGAPVFGQDFDQELGEYLTSHYRPIRSLDPDAPKAEWNAVVWERKPAGQPQ